MKQERMKVLEMIADGKISADEGAKLLEAMKHTGHGHYYGDFSADDWDVEEKLNDFSKNVDNFARDFSGRMSSAFKEMEPKLKKATKTVVEKTAVIIDDISKALNESLKNFEDECCAEEKSECCCSGEKAEDAGNDDAPREN